MTGKPRECDKGCGEVIAWDDEQRDGKGGYIEVNGNNQFHSKSENLLRQTIPIPK